MKFETTKTFLWAIFTLIRIVDMVMGSAVAVLCIGGIIIFARLKGDATFLGIMSLPFTALVLNGILNSWEKPPGRIISIILFVITAAFAGFLFHRMSFQQESAGAIFLGALAVFFLINMGLSLRGFFGKKAKA